jgi:hypothetical protein
MNAKKRKPKIEDTDPDMVLPGGYLGIVPFHPRRATLCPPDCVLCGRPETDTRLLDRCLLLVSGLEAIGMVCAGCACEFLLFPKDFEKSWGSR